MDHDIKHGIMTFYWLSKKLKAFSMTVRNVMQTIAMLSASGCKRSVIQ